MAAVASNSKLRDFTSPIWRYRLKPAALVPAHWFTLVWRRS